MRTSQDIEKEQQKKDGEEVSAQPGSTPQRGSSGLGEVSKPDHSAPESSVEILEGSETAHEVVPHLSPSAQIGTLAGRNRSL